MLGTALRVKDVRKVMTDYVKAHSLTSDTPGLVKRDDLLSEIFPGKTEVKWEELQQAILSKMSPGYSLQFGQQPKIIFKGKLDCIELSVATRSRNKKVTLINNLDTYQVKFRRVSLENLSTFSSDQSGGVRPQVPSLPFSRNQSPSCPEQKVGD